MNKNHTVTPEQMSVPISYLSSFHSFLTQQIETYKTRRDHPSSTTQEAWSAAINEASYREALDHFESTIDPKTLLEIKNYVANNE
jgi:hypothetical protein